MRGDGGDTILKKKKNERETLVMLINNKVITGLGRILSPMDLIFPTESQ